MQLRIDQSNIGVALEAVHQSLSEKVDKDRSERDQAMAAEVLDFLALQIVIPMLVSLCSAALYDVLKRRALAKLRRKELERITIRFCGKTCDTSAPLSKECLEILTVQLAPMGFNDSEIARMYELVKAVVEQHSRTGADQETQNIQQITPE